MTVAADRMSVQLTDRNDLGCGTGNKYLVRAQQFIRPEAADLNRYTEVDGNLVPCLCDS
jgi:hypothetical protein